MYFISAQFTLNEASKEKFKTIISVLDPNDSLKLKSKLTDHPNGTTSELESTIDNDSEKKTIKEEIKDASQPFNLFERIEANIPAIPNNSNNNNLNNGNNFQNQSPRKDAKGVSDVSTTNMVAVDIINSPRCEKKRGKINSVAPIQLQKAIPKELEILPAPIPLDHKYKPLIEDGDLNRKRKKGKLLNISVFYFVS